jgi:hypothetical protein
MPAVSIWIASRGGGSLTSSRESTIGGLSTQSRCVVPHLVEALRVLEIAATS